jgi:predicted dehydrogenase
MRKLRMGLVGGGEGAFIGAVHRMAAELDGGIELVCGVFGADPDRARAAGQRLYGLSEARSYGDVGAMLRGERHRADGMDFVVVATPNDSHRSIVGAALEAGFHVMCDKPLARSVAEARELAAIAQRSMRLLGLTHNYSGYPMVREARALVQAGALGDVRRVMVEYLQGWLARPIEVDGQKQARWRTDPNRAGVGGCMGDIGTHAEHLLRFVTGLDIEAVCADLSSCVAGRTLDDDANLLLRLSGAARGILSASQIAIGERNALSLRVYGTAGSLCWHQESPNRLELRFADGRIEIRTTADGPLSPSAHSATRLPGGHPEGFIEAFANLYRDFAVTLHAHLQGRSAALTIPDAYDGVRSLQLVEAAVASSRAGGVWQPVLNERRAS